MELLHWFGSALAWSWAAVLLLFFPVGLIFKFTGPVLGYPCLVLSVALLPTLAAASGSVRRRRAAAVLGYLQQAVRLNLSLNRFLAAAAHSESGRLARELNTLRNSLERGDSLALAMTTAMPELPERTIALVDYAEQMGKLPEALDRLVKEQVGESRKARQDRALEYWYPPLLLVVAGTVIGILYLYILPKFEATFHDFHIQLPAVTRWVFESAGWVFPVVLIVALIMLVLCGLRLRQALRLVRPTWLFRDLKDRILWILPLAHSLVLDRSLADLCTALSDSVELGYPLDQALARAQQLDLNAVLRRRVELWSQGLAEGQPIGEAARTARLPALLVGMLTAADASSTTGGVFRFLARFYSSRFVLRREVVRGAYLPAMTFLMGLLVATVALALFLPLRRLVDALANQGRH